jgi:hypothetical protein
MPASRRDDIGNNACPAGMVTNSDGYRVDG